MDKLINGQTNSGLMRMLATLGLGASSLRYYERFEMPRDRSREKNVFSKSDNRTIRSVRRGHRSNPYRLWRRKAQAAIDTLNRERAAHQKLARKPYRHVLISSLYAGLRDLERRYRRRPDARLLPMINWLGRLAEDQRGGGRRD